MNTTTERRTTRVEFLAYRRAAWREWINMTSALSGAELTILVNVYERALRGAFDVDELPTAGSRATARAASIY